MTVELTVLRVWSDGGTLAYGDGRDDAGRLVRFCGDWRPMAAIAEALAAGGQVRAAVDAFQILTVTQPEAD